MKNLWKGACAVVLFGAGGLATGPGCVDAEAPFFIVSAMENTCDPITVDSADLLGGVMDLRYACEYYATLRLANQLVRRGDEAKLQIETSRISITRFDVEVLDAAENPIQRADGSAARFTYPGYGFVDAARAGQPGEGLARSQLIDGATAQALGDALFDGNTENDVTTVIARVVAHGRTLGGDDVQTRPWDFPIDIKYGYLCECGPDPESSSECLIVQDQPFSCALTGGDCPKLGCIAAGD